jgi:hypothetical protein
MLLKLERKRQFGKSRPRCADNIKIKFMDVGCRSYEVDQGSLGQGNLDCNFECHNDSSDSINAQNFMNNLKLLSF